MVHDDDDDDDDDNDDDDDDDDDDICGGLIEGSGPSTHNPLHPYCDISQNLMLLPVPIPTALGGPLALFLPLQPQPPPPTQPTHADIHEWYTRQVTHTA